MVTTVIILCVQTPQKSVYYLFQQFYMANYHISSYLRHSSLDNTTLPSESLITIRQVITALLCLNKRYTSTKRNQAKSIEDM
uniref:Uncharacterized protein n=1 Tax=Setaria italica TaxID=4555 RepID=K3XNV8_SETIT